MKATYIVANIAAFFVFHYVLNAVAPHGNCRSFEVEASCPPCKCPKAIAKDCVPPVKAQSSHEEEGGGDEKDAEDKSAVVKPNAVRGKGSSMLGVVKDGGKDSHGFVGLTSPVWPLNSKGTVRIPSDTKRFCVDIGTFLSSPSSKKWWSMVPETFVMAVEANPFSYTMMHSLAHPVMVGNPANYWPIYRKGSGAAKQHPGPNCNTTEVQYCIQRTWKHITDNYDRFMLINAAGKDESGVATFNMGVDSHADTGSLFKFKSAKYTKQKQIGEVNVPMVQLNEVLEYAPHTTEDGEEIVWDTFKVDAQGADAMILNGGKKFLNKFMCVIAEFRDNKNYAMKDTLDPRKLMKSLGFAEVGEPGFYVNTAFKEKFEKGGYLCTATDEVRSKKQIFAALGITE